LDDFPFLVLFDTRPTNFQLFADVLIIMKNQNNDNETIQKLNEEFIYAVHRSNYKTYDELAPKIDVNAIDEYGYTALHYAAENGDTILVNALIQGGANVNTSSKNELAFTPLASAIYYMIMNDLAFSNYENVVELLIRNGADQRSLEKLYKSLKPSVIENEIAEVKEFLSIITELSTTTTQIS
jgi:hypothetical protein